MVDFMEDEGRKGVFIGFSLSFKFDGDFLLVKVCFCLVGMVFFR